MRPLTAVALLALFLASLAGCGGGDGDGIPATVWLEEAATAAAIVGGLAEKRIIGEELIQALESGSDPDEERVVRKLFANEVDTERLSRRIGLRVCGHI